MSGLVGTGTGSSGGGRLTPPRRFSLLVMAAIVTGTMLLGPPSQVWAVAEWSREVRFENTECGSSNNISSAGSVYASSPADSGGTYSTTSILDENDATSWEAEHDVNLRFVDIDLGASRALCGVRILHLGESSNPPVHEFDTVTFTVDTNCGTAGGLAGSANTVIPVGMVGAAHDSGTVDWAITARCFRVQAQASPTPNGDWRIYSIDFFGDPTEVSADCYGVAGAGGDDGLVMPAAGMWGPDIWGDVWHPSGPLEALSSLTNPGCEFEDADLFRYTPPEGFTKGDTHEFCVEVSSIVTREAQIEIRWSGLTHGGTLPILLFRHSGDSGGAAGAGHMCRLSNVPPGNINIQITIDTDTILNGLLIANVEGDPVLDNGDDGTGTDEDPLGDLWEDCDPPSDFLDVGGWVAYVACILIGVPQMVWLLFTGMLADGLGLLGQIITALDNMTANLLDGVFDGLGDILGDVLGFLFVPTDLDDDWQAFLDEAASKVPFGWFAQIVAAVSSSLGAGSTALPALDLTIGGATVDVGFSDALGGVAPYRGLILAGVSVVMLLGCLRWVMAAVGVSPSHSSDDDK